MVVPGCSNANDAALPTPTPTIVQGIPATAAPATATALPPSEEVVAQVNGEPIAREQWQRQVARVHAYLTVQEGIDPASETGQVQMDQAALHVLEEMIDEALIRQAARDSSVSITASQLDEVIERDIELAGGREPFDQWLSSHTLTLEEYRASTELQLLTSALREQVTSDFPVAQPQAHVRHILLGSEEEANQVLAELNSGGDFMALVATHSIDPGTREQGGDLGWLPRGLLPAQVDAAIWELGPGERSAIIKSDFGLHIVEMIEQDPARPLSLEMLQTLQQQAWEKWLVTKRANATIERWLTP